MTSGSVARQLFYVDQVDSPSEAAFVADQLVFWHNLHLNPVHPYGDGLSVIDPLPLPAVGSTVEVAGVGRGVSDLYPLSVLVNFEKGQGPFAARVVLRSPRHERLDLFEQALCPVEGNVEIDVEQGTARTVRPGGEAPDGLVGNTVPPQGIDDPRQRPLDAPLVFPKILWVTRPRIVGI